MRIDRPVPAGSVSRLIMSACVAALLAGCSAESTRFGESPFSNPFNGKQEARASRHETVAAAPTPRVQRAAIADITPAKPATPLRDDIGITTGAIPQRPSIATPSTPKTPALDRVTAPQTIASGKGGWTPIGGTTIQAGANDSVETLARRYGVPSSAIAQANGVSASQRLNPGQNVVIPTYSVSSGTPTAQLSPAPVAEKPVVEKKVAVQQGWASGAVPAGQTSNLRASGVKHVVNNGETLGGIAHRYHVPKADLARANSLKPNDEVRIGQSLSVPASNNSTAAAAPAQKLAAEPVKTKAAAKLEPIKSTPASVASLKAPVADKVKTVAATAHSDEGRKADRTVTGSLSPQPVRALDTEKTTPAAPAAPASVTASGDEPKFRWPVRGRMISRYGQNGSEGVDLAVPEGTAVRAAEDGKVAYAGSDLKNMGNMILIRHSNGYVSVYANNSQLNVKPGDEVRRGQTIAKAGQSGNASAPQVHFEIRKGKTPVNPETVVAE